MQHDSLTKLVTPVTGLPNCGAVLHISSSYRWPWLNFVEGKSSTQGPQLQHHLFGVFFATTASHGSGGTQLQKEIWQYEREREQIGFIPD